MFYAKTGNMYVHMERLWSICLLFVIDCMGKVPYALLNFWLYLHFENGLNCMCKQVNSAREKLDAILRLSRQ